MARSFSQTPGRLVGLKDGVTFFDTDAHPVQFYPAADKITVTGQTISFPDFHHANAYAYAAGLIGADVYQSCHSFVSIPYQEWGPTSDPGISDVLSETVLGTVDDTIDVLNIRVNLTRTSAPDQVNGNDVPVAFQEGEWVGCDGGTLLVEWLFPIVRMIRIKLADTDNGDGTRNVILQRKQSIKKTMYGFWRANNSTTSSGWTYGGTNGRFGHIVKSIQAKGPSFAPGGVITYRRGDGSECSLTDTSDYSAEYQGDIEIIPGRSLITPDSTGGSNSGKYFQLADIDILEDDSTTHTFTSKNLGPAPISGQTRHVIVVATSYQGAGSNAESISTCTINGVTASLAVKQETYVNATGANDHNFITSIWIAEVPTDDEGDIVFTFSDNFWATQIDVFSAYNLSSATPDHTTTRSTPGSTSLNTVADGFAVLGSLNNNTGGTYSFSGMANDTTETWVIFSPSSRDFRRLWAFQETDGSTLSLSMTDTASGAIAFAAASFH